MFNYEMRSFYAAFSDLMTDDQGQKIDGDGEGSMPNWVPVFETGLASDFPGPGAPVRAAALLLARPKSEKKLLSTELANCLPDDPLLDVEAHGRRSIDQEPLATPRTVPGVVRQEAEQVPSLLGQPFPPHRERLH